MENCLIKIENPYLRNYPYYTPAVIWPEIVWASMDNAEKKGNVNMLEDYSEYFTVSFENGSYYINDVPTGKLICTCPGPFELATVAKGLVLYKIAKKLG